MTTQPLRKAIVCACRAKTLFPVPRSPTTNFRNVLPFVFLICRANSKVSALTSVVGRAKKPQPCVLLKASIARNESTVVPGSATIVLKEESSARLSADQSCIPGTSKAFVLLKTILLRMALRSPGAGAFPFVGSPLLPPPSRSVFLPFCAPPTSFLPAGVPAFSRDAVVENAAEDVPDMYVGVGSLVGGARRLERHRQYFCVAITVVFGCSANEFERNRKINLTMSMKHSEDETQSHLKQLPC